jgi:RNA polymerase-binding protein DksA
MKKAEIRRRLEEERDRLLDEVNTYEDDLADSAGDRPEENSHSLHMAESATHTFDREMELTLGENARHALRHIERALEKLENGSYGRCDSCGKRIDEGRLKAVPYAGLCIDCQRREESGV